MLLRLGHPAEFLQACLDPPSLSQLRSSLLTLLDMGAIVPAEPEFGQPLTLVQGLPPLDMTFLGLHLAKMPVDVRLGKLLIVGALFNCVEQVLTMAAALGGRSPFMAPPGKQEDARKAHGAFHRADSFFSDHLAIVNAYDGWVAAKAAAGSGTGKAGFDYCRKHFLSSPVLGEMEGLRENFRCYLADTGFLGGVGKAVDADEGEEEEEGDGDGVEGGKRGEGLAAPAATAAAREVALPTPSTELLRCVLCAALGRQVVKACLIGAPGKAVKGASDVVKCYQSDGREVLIHPSSLTCKHVRSLLGNVGDGDDGHAPPVPNPRNKGQREAFIVFHKKVQSGTGVEKIYIHDATHVPALGMLLFAGDDLSVAPRCHNIYFPHERTTHKHTTSFVPQTLSP